MSFIEDPVDWAANEAGLSTSQKRAAAREAIKQEQRDLNEANAGKVDADGNAYVPLVVDGIVGPKTEGARNFVPATTQGDLDGPDGTEGLEKYAAAREILGMTDEQIIAGIRDGSLFPDQVNYPGAPGQPTTGPQPLTGEIWNFAGTGSADDPYRWEIIKEYGPNRGNNNQNNNRGGSDPYSDFLTKANIAGAKAIVSGFLQKFGLADIAPWALDLASQGLNADAILTELRFGDDPTVRALYDARFPAMKSRRDSGLPPLTEAEYIDLERGYYQIAETAGISPAFLNNSAVASVNALIAGDVSLSEWKSRVTLAEQAVNVADAETIAALTDYYQYDSGDLVATFLDPNYRRSPDAAPINITQRGRQFASAQLAGASERALGPNRVFSRELSEDLNRMNVQAREIATRIAPVAGLQTNLLGDEGLTPDELGRGVFGGASNVANMRRAQERRATRFKGRSGLLGTSSGMTGLGTTST